MRIVPDEFWNTGWSAAPQSLDGVGLHSFVSDVELCASIRDLQEMQQKNLAAGSGVGVYLSVNGKSLNDSVPSLKPISKCEQLVDLFDEKYSSHCWNLMAFGLHSSSYYLWQLGAVLRNEVDLNAKFKPTGRTDVDAFVGRYDATFAGIHTDYAHNFSFSVLDGKTMHVMEPSLFFSKDWCMDDYVASAIPLKYRTDNLCYFPFDYYHCATTPEKVSFNVNVAIWEKLFVTAGKQPDHVYGVYNSVVEYFTQLVLEKQRLSIDIPSFITNKLGVSLTMRALKQVSGFGMEVACPRFVNLNTESKGISRLIIAKIDGEIRIFVNGHIIKVDDCDLPGDSDLDSWLDEKIQLRAYIKDYLGI